MLAKQLQTKWAREAKQKRRVAARLPPFIPKRNIARRALLQKAELKVFDTILAFNFDTTGEIPATGQLCFITTGDTLLNRDGAVVMVKSIQIRGTLTFVPGAAATAAAVPTLYLIQDKQANGAAAAVTDVLNSTDLMLAMPNVPNQFRFKTLRRWQWNLAATAGVTTAYNNVTATMDEYIEFKKPLQLRYQASAGAITDLVSNNLFLIAGSNAQDDTVSFSGTARLRFTDI